MVGFSFFLFEGIGGIMPIMSATKNRKDFGTVILPGAMALLCFCNVVFGNLCYYTFGTGLDKPLITEVMPADSKVIITVKFLFMLNLVFSYPLTIYITNIILESYTFSKGTLKGKDKCRYWMKNLQRTIVLIIGILCAIFFHK